MKKLYFVNFYIRGNQFLRFLGKKLIIWNYKDILIEFSCYSNFIASRASFLAFIIHFN